MVCYARSKYLIFQTLETSVLTERRGEERERNRGGGTDREKEREREGGGREGRGRKGDSVWRREGLRSGVARR